MGFVMIGFAHSLHARRGGRLRRHMAADSNPRAPLVGAVDARVAYRATTTPSPARTWPTAQ